MAASSEIQYRIGGDTSALSAAFVKAASVAEAAGKQIEKKLGLKGAFQAATIAAGLSLDKIINKAVGSFMGGDESDWREALNAAERVAKLGEDAMMARLSATQKIAYLELQIEEAKLNTSKQPRTTGILPSLASMVGITPGKGMLGTLVNALSKESDSQVNTRTSNATGTVLQNEAEVKALKDAQLKQYQEIVKAEEQLEELGMSNERRHRLLLEDAESLKKDRDAAIAANKEWMPLQLAYTQKLISAEQVQLEIDRSITAEKNKQADLVNKMFNAAKKAGGAATDLATARDEALNFSLDEAASGERGSKADQEKANRILLYEETARSLRDKGPGASLGTIRTDKFDTADAWRAEMARRKSLGEKNPDPRAMSYQPLTAKYYWDAAQNMRKSLEGMKNQDRDPFNALTQRMTEAVQELVTLNTNLEQE